MQAPPSSTVPIRVVEQPLGAQAVREIQVRPLRPADLAPNVAPAITLSSASTSADTSDAVSRAVRVRPSGTLSAVAVPIWRTPLGIAVVLLLTALLGVLLFLLVRFVLEQRKPPQPTPPPPPTVPFAPLTPSTPYAAPSVSAASDTLTRLAEGLRAGVYGAPADAPSRVTAPVGDDAPASVTAPPPPPPRNTLLYRMVRADAPRATQYDSRMTRDDSQLRLRADAATPYQAPARAVQLPLFLEPDACMVPQ